MKKVKKCPSCRQEFVARSGIHYFCSVECRQRLTPSLCFMPWALSNGYNTARSRLHLPVICGGCGCYFMLFTDDDTVRSSLVCHACYRARNREAARLRELRADYLRNRPLLPVPGLFAAGLVLLLQQAKLRNGV